MKRILNQSTLWLLAAGLMLGSCKKQLEIDPRQSIDANIALTSVEGVDAAIINLYARLKGARMYGRDLITHPDALGDNGFPANRSGRLLPEANSVFRAHFTGTIWSNSYGAINQLNLILEAIPNLTVSQAIRDRWEGQLHFLRGLYYFDLVRVYAYIPGAVVDAQNRGGVPLILEGIKDATTALQFFPSRAPINDVYDQIVKDLEVADAKLAFPGLGINLANKAAAQLLLARVNLYRKNYAEAKKWTDAVITLAGSRMTTTANYISNWRAENHQETIFQVRYATNAENIGVNESLQTSFTTLITPGNPAVLGGFGDLVPGFTLLTELGIQLQGGNNISNFNTNNAVVASRSNDVRNLLYEPGSTGRGGKSFVECTKFIGKNGFPNLDNVPVLRIVEAYLTRAEIAATPGAPTFNAAAALADLKFVKARRYTGYEGSAEETADNALTGAALLEEILRQRRLEFAFEGHRFFDLKRLGRDIEKPHLLTPIVVPFTDIRILPEIPQQEVSANPNLQQNPGY